MCIGSLAQASSDLLTVLYFPPIVCGIVVVEKSPIVWRSYTHRMQSKESIPNVEYCQFGLQAGVFRHVGLVCIRLTCPAAKGTFGLLRGNDGVFPMQ